MNTLKLKARWLFYVLLLNCSLTFADSPARPSDYVTPTENGKYEFRMYAASYSKESAKKSGLYLAGSDDSDPIWTIDGYSFNVTPHSNGMNLIRFGPWASSTSDLAVAFYKNGDLLKDYAISELVTDESKLQHTVSHFFWLSAREYDETNNTLMMATMDGNEYIFSILTGEIISTGKTVIDDLDELSQLVLRQPNQVEFSSARIKESHYSLRRLIEINPQVMHYLPNKLKHNREFALLAVGTSGAAYKYLPFQLKEDRTIVLQALSANYPSLHLVELDKSIELDEEMVYTAVQRNNHYYNSLGTPWNKDENLFRLAVSNKGGFFNYRHAHVSLKSNRDLVLATIASEYDNQKEKLLNIIKRKNDPFTENEDRYLGKLDDVSHVSRFPAQLLSDKEIIEEFDKLLLVMVELDESKLPAIRKQAYEIMQQRSKAQEYTRVFLESIVGLSNIIDIVTDDDLRTQWQVGLEQQFVEDGLTLSSPLSWYSLKLLFSTLELEGFDYVISDFPLDNPTYLPFDQLEKLASHEYLASIARWNENFIAIQSASEEAAKQLLKKSIVYSTIGLDDDFTQVLNSGSSADIGLDRHLDRQLIVANGFIVPKEFEGAQLTSIEVAFLNPKNNKGGTGLVVGLYTDANGIPHKMLETYYIQLKSEPGSNIYTIESDINPVLKASQPYWLVVSAADLTAELGWLYANPRTRSGRRLQYLSDANTWHDTTRYGQQAFRINARK